MHRVVAVLLLLSLGAGGLVLGAGRAVAAPYALASCQQQGTGTVPAGLDQLTLEVTGTAPATAVGGDEFMIADASATITNPHPYAIEAGVIGLNVAPPPGASAFKAGFGTDSTMGPFTIPANGTFTFNSSSSGPLHYVAGGAPGSVMEFRPTHLSFGFGPGLGVGCTPAPGGTPFATTVVLDEPGYQFTCNVPSLGVTLDQTIDVVGSAPATVEQGARFAATDVIATSSPPITTTVHSTTFELASPANATPLSPLVLTLEGPFPVVGGEPFVGPPMTFEMSATGPPGSVVEFRPKATVTEIDIFETVTTVNCVVQPGQPPFATTTIVAPRDEVAVRVTRLDGEVVYFERQSLSSGDFSFTRGPMGRVNAVSGQGTFPGSVAVGDATLRVNYKRPLASLRLRDGDIDVRAASWLPVIPVGNDAVLGIALGGLDGQFVVVYWFVRDRA